MEEHSDQTLTSAGADPTPTADSVEAEVKTDDTTESQEYVNSDVLFKHLERQSRIVSESLTDRFELPPSILELSLAYEQALFSPKVPPKKQDNGTCEANPKLNFYPTFMLPETLATYHIFFLNYKIPVSCRANRPHADQKLMLRGGDTLPEYVTTEQVSKIFEGLGDEERAANSLEDKQDSALVELLHDSPRLAVIKRSTVLTHFAYPAVNLPPKVMSRVMEKLIIKKAEALSDDTAPDADGGLPVVSDSELARWLGTTESSMLEDRRKTMLAVALVTVQLECMRRFFTTNEMIRKIGETIHYTFKHGYVKQACKISNVELPNLVSYMGILHENRLGQSVLHNTLKDEARRDYIRDTIFLMLIHAWQSGMGIWQQCLEDTNVKELDKILHRKKRDLWSGFDERTIASDLADIIFPEKLLHTLQAGLPDFVSQSMMHNFRSFTLERSGILPAFCNALPSDFVPIEFKECPPPLWAYTYLLKLANYFMYHTDVAYNLEGEGLFECYCRCNLCTPHRCLATNTALLNEVQAIGSFELQPPPKADGSMPPPLRLTPGAWTSAYLRKFCPEDYYGSSITFYEDQSKPPKSELSACVITSAAILAQLHEIKKEREKFLLKKGHGVYIDPQTGEELNSTTSVADHHASGKKDKFDKNTTESGGKRASHRGAGDTRRGGPRGGLGRRRQPGNADERSGGGRPNSPSAASKEK